MDLPPVVLHLGDEVVEIFANHLQNEVPTSCSDPAEYPVAWGYVSNPPHMKGSVGSTVSSHNYCSSEFSYFSSFTARSVNGGVILLPMRYGHTASATSTSAGCSCR